MSGWTKGEVIALFGVIVTGISIAVPVINPEIRCSLLKDCSANSDIPTTGSEASEVGADYTKLKDLLAAGDFKGSDKETAERMLWVGNGEKEGYLGVKDIEKFPCQDLRTIDRLWRKHSNGKFGFSVQRDIRNEVVSNTLTQGMHPNIDYTQKFEEKVGYRVGDGWLDDDNLTFDLRGDGVIFLELGLFSLRSFLGQQK